jgi:hypothetical protein
MRYVLSLSLTALICAFSTAGPLSVAIDEELRAAWKREKVTPVGPAADGEFLRRVTLDLVGTIPTYAELTAFLAKPDREKAIERLLADPRFARHQAQVWDLILFGRDAPDHVRSREPFRAWLAAKIDKGVGFNKVAEAALLGEEPGSEYYLAQFRNRSEDAAESVSRSFLGTQLQCARCHDHPFDSSLTQRDFYGLAAFLARVVVLESGSGEKRKLTVGEKSTGEVLFSGSAKDARPGKKGDPVQPKFLGGKQLEEPPPPKGLKEKTPTSPKDLTKPHFSRKARLAEWVASPDNPFFARAVANRVWGQLLGRGIVHPVDDLGGKNTPSLPDLLDRMARELKEHKFDLRWLIGEIVRTKAYQLSHKGGPPDALPRWHERARVRPLSAEEMLASMCTACAFEESGGKFTGAIREYMRMYFGKPTNGLGDFQAGLREHLFMNNSGDVRDLIYRRKGSLADQLYTSADPWEKRVDRLYLSVLSRLPSEAERTRFVEFFKSEPRADGLVEDAIWVLLNTSEFRFQR